LKSINQTKSTIRNIKSKPYTILDAPDLNDDFYSNVLDWSIQTNTVGT